jgi:hypothetical protein
MNRLSWSCTLIFKQFVASLVNPYCSKNVRSIEQKLEKQIVERIEELTAEWKDKGPSYAAKLQATPPVSADAAKV